VWGVVFETASHGVWCLERSGCNGGGAVAKLHHAYNKNRFIDRAGNHEQAGGFKNMMTEDTQMCEGKYKKTREYDSYHNYCATTNSDWAAQVDVDNRRFAAIDCDDQWSGPRTAAQTEYFRALNDPKQGPFNITLSFAKYLYELNVDNFDPAENIPSDTTAMHEQKLGRGKG
jgi:hypothetical protein